MYGIRQEVPKTQNGSFNIPPKSSDPGEPRQTEGEITKGNCSGNKRRIEKNPWQPRNPQKRADDAKEFNVTRANPSEGKRKQEHGDSNEEPKHALH